MFEATVNADFTLPDGGAGKRYTKGQPLTDWTEIHLILNGPFQHSITKVGLGVHSSTQPVPEPEPAPVVAKGKKDSDKAD